MDLSILGPYLLAAMSAWVPQKKHAFYEQPQTTQARYTDIATDVAAVVLDPTERPLPGLDRAKTGLVLLGIARYESDFNAAVDDGRKRGDHGQSWCIGQILLQGGRTTREGWTGQELVDERQKCIRAMLHMAAESFDVCGRAPLMNRLALYAGGTCSRLERKGVVRMRLARWWWSAHPFEPTSDAVGKL